MVFTTQCPKCGKILWFSNKLAGTLTICPACGGTMRLESPAAPPPPSIPEPAPIAVDPLHAADTGHAMMVEGSPPPAPAVAVAAAEGAAAPTVDPSVAAASPAPAPASPPSGSPAAALEGVYLDARQDADDQVPAVVAQSFLTHQAAAAVGEAHVDVDQSDLVQWTQPPAPPAPTAPPVWAPAPLGGAAPRADEQGLPWHPPPASGPWSSLIHRKRTAGDDAASPSRLLPWGVAAIAGLIVVLGMLFFLPHAPSAGPWEQAHRKQILDVKQAAEELALSGKYREAYEKYQDLERLVAGQQIEDAYLKEELERSWHRRDSLFDKAMNGDHLPSPAAQVSPQTRPAAQSEISPPAAPVASTPAAPVPTPAAQTPPAPSALPPSTPAVIAPAPANSVAAQKPVASATTAPSTAPESVAQLPAPKLPPRPAIRASARRPAGLTDAQIGAGITKGAEFLLDQFDGPQLKKDIEEHHDGLDCMAVYALLQSAMATGDKRFDIHSPVMIKALEAMKALGTRPHANIADATYFRAMRAIALSLANRPDDRSTIDQDVKWLLRAQLNGAFTYSNEFDHKSNYAFWDNSNSQYGLLGVWSGAEAGITVPTMFWESVATHWNAVQMESGQWYYNQFLRAPTQSMTLAGIASLFVADDYLGAAIENPPTRRPPFSPALAKGLGWLETDDNSVVPYSVPDGAIRDCHYTLYGLERVGLASGFKYFGSHDWYREHAKVLLDNQTPRGNWGPEDPFVSIVDSSYALLFLARGRHPIIMNKLRFAGNWANRPRDAANLARFATGELERPLNWQVVPIDRAWQDWTDSPILYLASDSAPNLSDADREKIKSYIQNGGMLLTQSDGGSAEFSTFVDALGKQLFPQYGWTTLPGDHPLLSTSYKITTPPESRIISNGSRILMMHWPSDVTVHWQLRQQRDNRPFFELGVDLLLYAAGKSELKNRLASDYIPQSPGPASASIPVGRLSYDGNWDPEPAAWPRGNRWFREATGMEMALQPTPLEELASANPPLAHLTGTGKLNLTEARIASVRKYVQGGGVLLIDPCGTPGEFYRAVREDLLPRAFPGTQLQPVEGSSPLLNAGGEGMSNVTSPAIREFARTLPDVANHTRPMILRFGRGHVIVLPLDLTSGLLGVDAWGIAGYQQEDALALMKNIVLWTWDGQREK